MKPFSGEIAVKKMILLAPLFLSVTGCGNSGPTLTSREKFVCTQCHKLPFPDQHSAAEWPGVIAKMMAYMQANQRAMPDAKEQAEILKFYQTKAGR